MESPNKRRKLEVSNTQPGPSRIQSNNEVKLRRRLNKTGLLSSDAEKTMSEPNSISRALSSSEESDNSILEYESDQSENYDINNLPRFQFKGRTWNLFKPICKDVDTLYAILLEDPKSAVELALEFTEGCKLRPREALIKLVKLCLDCADCQNLSLQKFMNNFQLDIEKILKEIDSDCFPSPVFDTGKYLFSDKSVLAKVLKCAIFTFMQKFVVAAHQNKYLYTDQFKIFLKFLNKMCNAKYRHLWCTGHMISMKILTSICTLKYYLKEQTGGSFNRLNGFINTLFCNFVSLSKPSDKHCEPVKRAALRELGIWINCSPHVFIEHFDCIKLITKYYISSNLKSVRYSALVFCKKLVYDESVTLSGTPLEIIIKAVGPNLEDVDDKVVLAALDTFEAINTRYIAEASKEGKHFRNLLKCMYYSNYEIAKKAGFCIAQLFRHEYSSDDFAILIELARMSTKKYPNMLPMFVEACIPNHPALQNWGLIIDIFCNEKYENVAEKETISELALEAAQQILHGQSTKPRTMPRNDVKLSDLNHHEIAENLLPLLRTILEINRSKAKILRNFLGILIKISPKVLRNELCGHLEDLLRVLKMVFIHIKDERALEAICDALLYCSEQVLQLKLLFKMGITDLTSQYCCELIFQLQSPKAELTDTAKKVSVLFSKFNLNEYLSWPTIHDSWGLMGSNIEFLESMTACCHWSLVWNIRDLKSSPTAINSHMKSIIGNFKEFSASCFNLIGNATEEVQINIFRRICASYLALAKEKDDCNMSADLSDLKQFIVDDLQILRLFWFVFEHRIVGNEKISTVEHGLIVIDVMSMALCEILPPNSLSRVFKYYDKHYDLYGKAIEKVVNHITTLPQEHALPMLVVSALTEEYAYILEKDGVVDIKRQSAKDLLNTSMRLADFGPMKSEKLTCTLLLFAINYAVFHKRYYFLIFVKPFVTHLKSDKERKEILDFIKIKVPDSDVKTDSVLYFINNIKQSLKGQKKEKKKLKQKSVTSITTKNST